MATMIEIFAQVRDEGLASARNEGRLEGRTRMIRMIVRQARRRFGPEPRLARRVRGWWSLAESKLGHTAVDREESREGQQRQECLTQLCRHLVPSFSHRPSAVMTPALASALTTYPIETPARGPAGGIPSQRRIRL